MDCAVGCRGCECDDFVRDVDSVRRRAVGRWIWPRTISAGLRDTLPISVRDHEIPTISTRKGLVLMLNERRLVVNECAELLNRGPLGGAKKGSKDRTILDEKVIKQLGSLSTLGNFGSLIN
jgi:hypothetical protein